MFLIEWIGAFGIVWESIFGGGDPPRFEGPGLTGDGKP